MPVVALADLKRHLNITSATHDAELQSVLDAAEGWASKYVGSPLGSASATYSVRSATATLVLPVVRLASVSSVTDPNGVVVTASSTFDLTAGIVYAPYRRSGAWSVAVTLSATPGADVALAVQIIAAHLWETQRGAAPTPFAPGEEPEDVQGVGYAIPNRARALLDPHVPVVVA